MVFRVSTDGIIHVVAGNGIAGFSGDGGPATSASLSGPRSIAVDPAGNILISDYGNGRIRKVSANGTISTVLASIASPFGITTDPSGSIYFIEYFGQRVRKISPNGTVSTIAGNGSFGFSGDNGPATQASLGFPADIALDSAGNLYIADTFNYRLRKVNPQGIITTIAGNGQFGLSGDGGPAVSAVLSQIQGVAVDSSGNIYVGDINFSRVRRINPQGVISTVAGSLSSGFSGDGGPAVNAVFDSIQGVAVDSAGNLYIADNQNDRVRKVSPNGIISEFAGAGRFTGNGGPATSAHIAHHLGSP
jgi:sugar lactone lactonase YvrE